MLFGLATSRRQCFTLVGRAAGHGAEVRGQEDPGSRIPPCLLPAAVLGATWIAPELRRGGM